MDHFDHLSKLIYYNSLFLYVQCISFIQQCAIFVMLFFLKIKNIILVTTKLISKYLRIIFFLKKWNNTFLSFLDQTIKNLNYFFSICHTQFQSCLLLASIITFKPIQWMPSVIPCNNVIHFNAFTVQCFYHPIITLRNWIVKCGFFRKLRYEVLA